MYGFKAMSTLGLYKNKHFVLFKKSQVNQLNIT